MHELHRLQGTSAAKAGGFQGRLNRSGKPLRHPKTLSSATRHIRSLRERGGRGFRPYTSSDLLAGFA
jgi:hypothetical protein